MVLGPDDALLAFSLPPYSRPTLELLEDAQKRGLVSVVVTDRASAPAAGLATHALPAPTHNLLFTNAIAALVALVNALCVDLARRRGGEGLRALSELNRVLADERPGPRPRARLRRSGGAG